jgi:hypothetical protein
LFSHSDSSAIGHLVARSRKSGSLASAVSSNPNGA